MKIFLHKVNFCCLETGGNIVLKIHLTERFPIKFQQQHCILFQIWVPVTWIEKNLNYSFRPKFDNESIVGIAIFFFLENNELPNSVCNNLLQLCVFFGLKNIYKNLSLFWGFL